MQCDQNLTLKLPLSKGHTRSLLVLLMKMLVWVQLLVAHLVVETQL